MAHTSRRAVLSAGGMFALVGIAPAAIARPDTVVTGVSSVRTHPDAELHRLYTQIETLNAEQDRLCDLADTFPAESIEREAHWTAVYALTDRFHEIMAKVAIIQPATRAGLIIKAKFAMMQICPSLNDGDVDKEDAVAWSLCRDLIGEVV